MDYGKIKSLIREHTHKMYEALNKAKEARGWNNYELSATNERIAEEHEKMIATYENLLEKVNA